MCSDFHRLIHTKVCLLGFPQAPVTLAQPPLGRHQKARARTQGSTWGRECAQTQTQRCRETWASDPGLCYAPHVGVCASPGAQLKLNLFWILWPESLAFKAKASQKMRLSSWHFPVCACDLFCYGLFLAVQMSHNATALAVFSSWQQTIMKAPWRLFMHIERKKKNAVCYIKWKRNTNFIFALHHCFNMFLCWKVNNQH